ncbi:MAG TPA: hypothetical protein ENH01_05305 [Nitrospirae bacterium]|nr:hypothetical protein [Nitrospirota bacterium]
MTSSDFLIDPSLRPKLVIDLNSADYYCDYDNVGHISLSSYGTCSGNGCIPAGCGDIDLYFSSDFVVNSVTPNPGILNHFFQITILAPEGKGYSI